MGKRPPFTKGATGRDHGGQRYALEVSKEPKSAPIIGQDHFTL